MIVELHPEADGTAERWHRTGRPSETYRKQEMSVAGPSGAITIGSPIVLQYVSALRVRLSQIFWKVSAQVGNMSRPMALPPPGAHPAADKVFAVYRV